MEVNKLGESEEEVTVMSSEKQGRSRVEASGVRAAKSSEFREGE